jgi:hypothetical protein
MLNVAVCTPSYGGPHIRYLMSLIKMFLVYQQTPVTGRDPNEQRAYSYNVIQGSKIDTAREEMMQAALDLNATHLLFLDEDMGFHPLTLNTLLMRQQPFVACNYPMKTWPQCFTARSLDKQSWVSTKESNTSLEEVDFCGLGFALIERQVLEAVGPAPNFLNYWDDEAKAYSTEDRYFCHKVKEKGFPVYIDHDASKLVYHNGSFAYSWDDPMDTLKKHPYAERIRIE